MRISSNQVIDTKMASIKSELFDLNQKFYNKKQELIKAQTSQSSTNFEQKNSPQDILKEHKIDILV
jgi:hypothetical protein